MKPMPGRRLHLITWGVVAALLAGLAVAVAVLLWHTRADALDVAEARVTRFAAGAEAGMNRTLLSFDVLLAHTEELLALRARDRAGLDVAAADTLLRGVARQNLLLRYVALLDARGAVLASSASTGELDGVELPEGFLAAALAPAVATLSVSQPVVSPTSSERVLYMARQLRMGDGTPLLVVAQVPTEALVAVLMQGLEVPDMEVTLERTQGVLLLGVEAPQGTVERQERAAPALQEGGADDGVHAWQASARLSGKPAMVVARPLIYPDLWATVSLPRDAALAGWRQEALTVLFGALLFAATVVAAGSVVALYLRRMHSARRVVARSKATLDQALEAMVSGFVLLDAQRCVVQWNLRFEEMFPWLVSTIGEGVPFRRVLETTVHYHLPGASAEEKRAWVEERLQQQCTPRGGVEQLLPNGHYVQITERATADGGVVIIYHDVTDLRLATAEVEHLAFYDQLTGLPNRRLLLDQLGDASASAVRTGTHGAVLFIDLDHFKTLNDTLGHEIGDYLLQQVARRLESGVRVGDIVARLGGDEFVVLLAGLATEAERAREQVRAVAEKVVQLLAQPYPIAGQSYHGSCSVGAALFGSVLQTAAEVLKQADIAMYQVKAQRGNAVCFFDPRMQVALSARARLESDLQDALREGQFLLHLQPQFTRDGAVVGVEALLRWQHPERGLVLPAEFIGVAEDSELIVPLGRWVLASACELLARWQASPRLRELSLSVNVSARQFRSPDFVEQLSQLLLRSGAPAHRLELELTESLVLEDVEDSIAKMHQLRTKGVRFAVDDFGTGYSSLAYLTRLPLHRLKIDRTFVHHLGESRSDDVVVQTILGMARNLDLEVVAEGVETEEQRSFLALHGCDVYQGYLLAHPMPVEALQARYGDAPQAQPAAAH
ncbi:diguanylate cyclase [Diaphorobacter nitroreducens]|uniref:bifunctional diguanylate cyclase/phosphodiesterase n=1 Tax=Diaphorobacter nitroreducens TaxID=164759 RepID=UPI000B59C03D|nr:EAL domain-containing protein [Diaphorobacter nitroreducens]ASI67102.1 diguanylate cyclase [Diaphorobacter nitroreducens]